MPTCANGRPEILRWEWEQWAYWGNKVYSAYSKETGVNDQKRLEDVLRLSQTISEFKSSKLPDGLLMTAVLPRKRRWFSMWKRIHKLACAISEAALRNARTANFKAVLDTRYQRSACVCSWIALYGQSDPYKSVEVKSWSWNYCIQKLSANQSSNNTLNNHFTFFPCADGAVCSFRWRKGWLPLVQISEFRLTLTRSFFIKSALISYITFYLSIYRYKPYFVCIYTYSLQRDMCPLLRCSNASGEDEATRGKRRRESQ